MHEKFQLLWFLPLWAKNSKPFVNQNMGSILLKQKRIDSSRLNAESDSWLMSFKGFSSGPNINLFTGEM